MNISSGTIYDDTKQRKLSSMYIDASLNMLRQDDPILIDILKEQYIVPPSNEPYNVSRLAATNDGQFGQAKYASDTFSRLNSNESKKRFFVEAGAYDGVLYSNTLLLENKYKWSGLLIEPNPESFKLILEKHRNVWAINTCLSSKPFPEIKQFHCRGIFGGTIENGISPTNHQERREEMKREKVFWKRKYVNHEDTYTRLDGGVGLINGPIKMQCFPLYSILKALEKPYFDFLSLDIEGTEHNVLHSAFKYNTDFKFNLGTIETSHLEYPQFKSSYIELMYLMKQKGYEHDARIGEDDIFIHGKFKMSNEL